LPSSPGVNGGFLDDDERTPRARISLSASRGRSPSPTPTAPRVLRVTNASTTTESSTGSVGMGAAEFKITKFFTSASLAFSLNIS